MAASEGSSSMAPVEAAFFDLDKTIISRSSSLALSRPMYRAGMLSLTKGWERSQVEALVQDVIIDVIDPFVYQEALDLMELHRVDRRRVYIVSSSPEEVVRPLARHFGVSGVIATRARVRNGRYTGELEFYCAGEGKAQAIRTLADRVGIDLEGSYAYSDSISDLPMLSAVGHPVAVNPDRELRREAEQRGWDVREFRRPVRLRTRIASAATHPRTQVVAGVGAALAVAAVFGWVVIRSRLSGRVPAHPGA